MAMSIRYRIHGDLALVVTRFLNTVTNDEVFGFYKKFYYLFCLICAFIIYKFEAYSLIIGFVESIIILFILFISFLLPYFRYASLIADGNIEEIYFYDSKIIINFMISGFIVILSFQNSLNMS